MPQREKFQQDAVPASEATHWTERFKPAASMRTQVLLAACLWTLAGSGLSLAGSAWTLAAVHGVTLAIAFTVALTVGWAKGRLVLSRTARRTLSRIEARGDGRCLGGFLSWGSWLLVLVMIFLGRTLRHSGLPGALLGPLYVAIGIALLTGSTTFWQAGSRLR